MVGMDGSEEPAIAVSGLSTGGKIGIGAGISAFCASALAVVLLRMFVLHLKRKTTPMRQFSADISSMHSYRCSTGELTKFSYRELEIATNNFSNFRGEGTHGEVYEGTLEQNLEIAVKRLFQQRTLTEASLEYQLQSLEAKIKTIGLTSLIHPNLVRMIGYCLHEETGEQLLVYEFCHCKSLADWLSEPTPELDTDAAFDKELVVLYVARALEYVHSKLQFHLNIKPENILLNRHFHPKVSDYGVAQILDVDLDTLTTTDHEPQATWNWYRAPELRNSSSEPSPKSDVFSFGIVLLELVSGRRVYRVCEGREEYLPLLVLQAVENGDGEDLPFLEPEVQSHEADDENSKKRRTRRLIRVALWCLPQDPTRRPDMSDVIAFINPYLEYNNEKYPVDTSLPDGLRADMESVISAFHNLTRTYNAKCLRSPRILQRQQNVGGQADENYNSHDQGL